MLRQVTFVLFIEPIDILLEEFALSLEVVKPTGIKSLFEFVENVGKQHVQKKEHSNKKVTNEK